MSAIFDSETLGPTERLIMLALADHADDSGRCYPSISRLASRTGLSERALRTNIRSLEAQGYLRILIGAGQGGSNVYFVSATPAADAPRQGMPPGSRCPTPRHLVPVTPAADAPKPSGTIIEPSIEEADASSGNAPEREIDDPPPKRSKRGVSLPPDWAPSDRNLTDARSRNFTEDEIHEQAAAFRDYHLARGTTFKDWDAAWRTWLGNARRFARPSQAPRPGNGSAHDGLLAGFQRAAARR